MMPLNYLLKKCMRGNKFTKSPEKINHLIYIDHIKVFAKNGKELETLIQTIRIHSQEIGIGYCNILTNKREITSDATGVMAPTTSGGFGQ